MRGDCRFEGYFFFLFICVWCRNRSDPLHCLEFFRASPNNMCGFLYFKRWIGNYKRSWRTCYRLFEILERLWRGSKLSKLKLPITPVYVSKCLSNKELLNRIAKVEDGRKLQSYSLCCYFQLMRVLNRIQFSVLEFSLDTIWRYSAFQHNEGSLCHHFSPTAKSSSDQFTDRRNELSPTIPL